MACTSVTLSEMECNLHLSESWPVAHPGAEPGKMRDCLVQGEKEAVRARIAHLKHFVITFTGEMNLLIYESHAQPVICSFAGTEDHQYKDTYQNTTAL